MLREANVSLNKRVRELEERVRDTEQQQPPWGCRWSHSLDPGVPSYRLTIVKVNGSFPPNRVYLSAHLSPEQNISSHAKEQM